MCHKSGDGARVLVVERLLLSAPNTRSQSPMKVMLSECEFYFPFLLLPNRKRKLLILLKNEYYQELTTSKHQSILMIKRKTYIHLKTNSDVCFVVVKTVHMKIIEDIKTRQLKDLILI